MYKVEEMDTAAYCPDCKKYVAHDMGMNETVKKAVAHAKNTGHDVLVGRMFCRVEAPKEGLVAGPGDGISHACDDLPTGERDIEDE